VHCFGNGYNIGLELYDQKLLW